MADQLEVLKLIATRLDTAGLDYMITGSIAAGLYGQPRMTRDIDIVAALSPHHVPRLGEVLGDEFIWDPEAARAAIARRGIFNVVHRQAVQKVDFIVRDDRDYEVEKFDRRRLVEIDGQPMWMISPEDLVLSKLVWAKDSRSELQLRDVQHVLAMQPDLDWPYLNRWSVRLTVGGLLSELRG